MQTINNLYVKWYRYYTDQPADPLKFFLLLRVYYDNSKFKIIANLRNSMHYPKLCQTIRQLYSINSPPDVLYFVKWMKVSLNMVLIILQN
jgi:hypothetical protein